MAAKFAKAFIPHDTFQLELDGKRYWIHKKVAYMIPHGMTLGVAVELETQGEGRILSA